MSTPATASLFPAFPACTLPSLPFGSQVDIALGMMKASTESEMEAGMAQASAFASSYDFEMPGISMPPSKKDYSFAMKAFAEGMRPVVEARFEEIRKSENPMEDLLDGNLIKMGEVVDLAIAGLASFESSNKLLFSILQDIGRRIEGVPGALPIGRPVSRLSLIVAGTLAAAEVFLLSTDYVIPAAVVGGLVVVSALNVGMNWRSYLRNIAENDRRSGLVDGYRENLAEAVWAHRRLFVAKDKVPHTGTPCPIPKLPARKAAISAKAPKDPRTLILEPETDMKPFEDRITKYLAVMPADRSGVDIRTTSEQNAQIDLLLPGEHVLGAGTMNYLNFSHDTGTILIDGRSPLFSTNHEGVSTPMGHIVARDAGLDAVHKAFETIFGKKFSILEPMSNVELF